MEKKRVLITGMSGLIGGIMRRALEGTYELVALNRRDIPGVRSYQADISDLEAIRPAFEGVDVVLHLAANANANASLDDVVHHNITGTCNVFEAARAAGVRRIVSASSGSVIRYHERDEPYRTLVEGPDKREPPSWPMITHRSPFRPDGLYGCSKVWGEALARDFSDEYDMSIICVRIGAVVPGDQPNQPRLFSAWCSHRDVAQMLEKCIAAPHELRFDIFYAVSNNRRNYRDLDHSRNVLGYEPKDNADTFAARQSQ